MESAAFLSTFFVPCTGGILIYFHVIFCRGGMASSVEEVEAADEQKVPNGEHTDKSKNENVGGCCQGANGVSCCMTAGFDNNRGIGKATEAHKKQGHRPSLNWPLFEDRNVRIAIGVFGVVAAAAVAYNVYRRSG